MGIKLEYVVSKKEFDWKISLFGLILLSFRFWFMSVFNLEDGSFHPKVFHASYFISILICLSMVFSFRVKPLNTLALAILPSIIFSLFLHDIPLLIDPSSGDLEGNHKIGGLLWWNYLTVHTPIPFVAAYTYLTRKETISKEAYFIGLWILIAWFFSLDDMENGTLNGKMYIIVGGSILIVWSFIYIFWICRDVKNVSALIAPVLEVKGIKWISKKGNILK